MRVILFLFTLAFCTYGLTQIVKEKTTFRITKTTPYCGGANPPEEILEETSKKKIPIGEKFYIIKGYCNTAERKIVDTLMMDSTGIAGTSLKPGCYSIINDFGYNKIDVDTANYDINCLKQLWETPLFKFEVIKGKSESFSFNIEGSCPYNKPCYKGEIQVPM